MVGISKAFEKNKTLKSLNLVLNGGDDKGAALLARGLRYNPCLAELQLDNIGPEGTEAMRSIHFFYRTIEDAMNGSCRNSSLSDGSNDGILHNWRISCCTRDINNRLPLHRSADMGLQWTDGTREILEANYPALEEVDINTGLYPFMLAAVGRASDLTSVFKLLTSNPGLLHEHNT